jgi:uncharacterized membrane protein
MSQNIPSDQDIKTHRRVVRVRGSLREITTIRDSAGDILEKIMRPLHVEFRFRDILEVILGSMLLAIPVGFTEEVWRLGEILSNRKIFVISVISILFLSLFIYNNSYHGRVKGFAFEYIKRVIATYIIALLVVSMLLSLIEVISWSSDWILALKRTVLVGLPASMSAAVADMIK